MGMITLVDPGKFTADSFGISAWGTELFLMTPCCSHGLIRLDSKYDLHTYGCANCGKTWQLYSNTLPNGSEQLTTVSLRDPELGVNGLASWVSWYLGLDHRDVEVSVDTELPI